MMDGAYLAEAELTFLGSWLQENFGLQLPGCLGVIGQQLQARISQLGLGQFSEYCALLSANNLQERRFVLELSTNPETYFFRQPRQLDWFRRMALPQLRRQNERSRRLCLWSAGCATGEEAYCLAALVLESGLFEGWDVQVLGTDASLDRVEAARRGSFGGSSFRAAPAAFRQRYFEASGCFEGQSYLEAPGCLGTQAGAWQVCPELMRLCQFQQLNLCETEHAFSVGRADVIFCRNVLIYLTPNARQSVVESFQRRLLRGGYLFLGAGENLGMQGGHLVRVLKAEGVYQKPPAEAAK